MSTQVTNYQCPACTGPLHFDVATGKLKCEYCGTSFEVAEIEAIYLEKDTKAAEAKMAADAEAAEAGAGAAGADDALADSDACDVARAAAESAAAGAAAGADADVTLDDTSEWDLSGLNEDWGTDADGIKVYSCPSCGAELICDATTAATSCPYCGNPSIIPGQFAGALKPDFVIPFKLSKDDAIQALKKHYGGKPLLPKEFSNKNHIEEIKGIYVPFWMFDGEAEGSVTFEATRTHTFTHGGYRITETDHFDVWRSGKVSFEKVPVDASSKMPDDYMDSIEPFDYSELKPFSNAYLPGFLADKYDVSVEDSYERADQRYRGSFEEALKDTVTGYVTCIKKSSAIKLNRGKVHYALLPVWLLCTKWNDKDFLFAMNGQTGKLVGDLPVSFRRALGLYAAIAAPLIAIGSAITLWLMS